MVARAAHKKPTAIIVGAGIGGTASAARLSQAGFDVTGMPLPPLSQDREHRSVPDTKLAS